MEKRLAAILELIDGRGVVPYGELAKLLGVSSMTIRRDCEELFRGGKIIRTIGGIRRAADELVFYEAVTDERIYANTDEKREIAKLALELIEEPRTIFIDGSTTGLALAKLVKACRKGLSIVTHAPLICLALRSGINTVICAGGEFDSRSLCYVGPDAENLLKSFSIDIAFVSTAALLAQSGAFDSDPATTRVKQAAVSQAKEVILLADHTKFGRRGLSKAFDLTQITHVITDAHAPAEDVILLRQAGIKVSIAS